MVLWLVAVMAAGRQATKDVGGETIAMDEQGKWKVLQMRVNANASGQQSANKMSTDNSRCGGLESDNINTSCWMSNYGQVWTPVEQQW